MLVSEPTLSIGEIGSVAGYENQSKFSAAFKSVMGVTPRHIATNIADLIGAKSDLFGYRMYYPGML